MHPYHHLLGWTFFSGTAVVFSRFLIRVDSHDPKSSSLFAPFSARGRDRSVGRAGVEEKYRVRRFSSLIPRFFASHGS